jgi:hypothetical protein
MLGLNLPRLFGQLGLVQTEMAFIHPVYLHGSGSAYEYSFFEANPYFIGSRLGAEARNLTRKPPWRIRRGVKTLQAPSSGSLDVQNAPAAICGATEG